MGSFLSARALLYAVRDKVIPDEIPTNTTLVRYDIVINWNDPHYQVEAVSYTQTYFFDLKQDGTVNMYRMYPGREAGEFIGGFRR